VKQQIQSELPRSSGSGRAKEVLVQLLDNANLYSEKANDRGERGIKWK